MIIAMEKSVDGKKVVKNIHSEDIQIYFRDGWKKSDSTVTEKPVVKEEPKVEETKIEDTEVSADSSEKEEPVTEEKPYVYYGKKKRNRY